MSEPAAQPPARRGKRIYSDGFVQRYLARIDEMAEQNRAENPVLPSPDEGRYDSRLYQQCRAVAKNRYRSGYVDGFWFGWCLREHAPMPAPESEVTG
jgi:hypothetical protein